MSPPRGPVTAGLLAALRGAGFAVGDGEAPRPLPVDEEPYGVLRTVPGGGRWGPPLTDPEQCATWLYEVVAVGRTRHHASSLLDVLDAVVVGRTASGAFTTAIAAGAGYLVRDRSSAGDGVVERDGDVYNAVGRYQLQVVPA